MRFVFKKAAVLLLLLYVLAMHCTTAAEVKNYLLKSPDHNLQVKIAVNDSITYTVSYKNSEVILPSAIALILEDRTLGLGAIVKSTKTKTVKEELRPVYGKFSSIRNDYNELILNLSGNYAVVWRAYDEGIAYRFITTIKDSVKVINERADFNLAGSPSAIFPETDNLTTWEMPYVNYPAKDAITEGKTAITPALFSHHSGMRIIIAESDVLDYPGMYIRKKGDNMTGVWANYASKSVLGSWGDFVSVVKERANFIAKTEGKRAFPWRIVMATDDDKSLLTNELVYKLAGPQQIKEVSWIKPGKAAWEWWHDAMLPGAAIPSGMDNRNTALYKHYVDFAAEYNLEYLMIDAGWSNNHDMQKVNPKVNIEEVISHAASKNVGVFLWCVATTLMANLDENLDFIQSLGAKGLKVDFIDRDDQEAITWFEIIAKAAAKRKLMVNFHGCSKPTGLQKAYPNIVNYEAVRGAESAKWDYTIHPDHQLTIPFIRMLAGPLDYTPGSMRNVSKEKFKPVDPGLPSTMGTRTHELAMFVIYDQAFAMLCDSPEEYRKYPDIMKFLAAVPTTFEDTKVLDAKVAEYAMMAKKKGESWFVGAMTNWESRELTLDLSFLPEGKTYTAEIYTDTADSNIDASQYKHQTIQVNNQFKTKLTLAKGGGAVLYIHP